MRIIRRKYKNEVRMQLLLLLLLPPLLYITAFASSADVSFRDGAYRDREGEKMDFPSPPIVEAGSVSPAELRALEALFNSTNGNDWRWRPIFENGPIWDFSSFPGGSATPCVQGRVWQGLNCSCSSYINNNDDDTINDDDFYGFDDDYYDAVDCVITGLVLSLYDLDGYLPSQLGNLTHCKRIVIDLNPNLRGPIPSSLESLVKLRVLELGGNAHTGRVLDLSLLTQLEVLNLGLNHLTGPVPNLDANTQLVDLNLFNNLLSSSLPSLDSLVRLETLLLDFNGLTSNIPSLDALKNIRALYLSTNQFEGSIPSLDNLVECEVLFLDDNHLTSSIPSLSSLTQLRVLNILKNLLSNSIPALNSLIRLNSLEAYTNLLSNTIPALNNLVQLQVLDLYDNLLEGSLPSLNLLTKLEDLWVHKNRLHGSLPNSVIGNLYSLVSLQLQNNRFSGSLSSDVFENLTQLQTLYLSNNQLKGELPVSMARMANLTSVQLQNNQFRGSLNGKFDPSLQRRLSIIQLSSNQLTGTIGGDIFELPSLNIFAVVSNCLKGPLPSASICNSRSLEQLLLDGLHTASSCQKPMLGGLIPGAYLLGPGAAGLADQLHDCFFSMPRLNVLHMSGNGLIGTLPSNMSNFNLTKLTLSHNAIEGTIPRSLQDHREWNSLDLSFNRFTGELSSSFTQAFDVTESEINTDDTPSGDQNNKVFTSKSLKLSINRLSGPIPNSLKQAKNLTILDGNLFSCDISGKSLPQSDSESVNYSCGSDSFNVPFYTWMAIAGIATVLIATSLALLSARPSVKIDNNSDGDSNDSNDYISDKSAVVVPVAASNQSSGRKRDSEERTIENWARSNINLIISWVRLTEEEQQDEVKERWSRPSSLSSSRSSSRPSSISLSPSIPSSISSSSSSSSSPLKNISSVGKLFIAIRKLTFYCALYGIAVLGPVYVVTGVYYSTYTNRYAWVLSTSFLSGWVAFAVLFVAMTVFLCLWVVLYHTIMMNPSSTYASSSGSSAADADQLKSTSKSTFVVSAHGSEFSSNRACHRTGSSCSSSNAENSDNLSRPASKPREKLIVALSALCIALLNMTVVVLANVGFVYVSIYDSSRLHLFAVQFALAVFKYLWNGQGLRRVANMVFSFSHDVSQTYISKYVVSLELRLALFNNIVIPCFVVAAIEPDCFYTVLVPPPDVTASYSYPGCTQFGLFALAHSSCGHHHKLETTKTSFAAPFSYSYQCSASITTYYAAAFVYLCAILGFFAPLWQLFLLYLYNKQLSRINSAAVSSSLTAIATKAEKERLQNSPWTKMLGSLMIPRLLRPVPLVAVPQNGSSGGAGDSGNNGLTAFPPPGAVYFNSTGCLVSLVTLLGLLLTFGTTFPLLGVVICVTMVCYTFFEQFKLGRFVAICKQQRQFYQQQHIGSCNGDTTFFNGSSDRTSPSTSTNDSMMFDQLLSKVDKECASFALPSPRRWMWVFVTLSSWFCAFVLFDTLGNVVGESAWWVLVLMAIAVPVLLLVAYYFGSTRKCGRFSSSSLSPHLLSERERELRIWEHNSSNNKKKSSGGGEMDHSNGDDVDAKSQSRASLVEMGPANTNDIYHYNNNRITSILHI